MNRIEFDEEYKRENALEEAKEYLFDELEFSKEGQRVYYPKEDITHFDDIFFIINKYMISQGNNFKNREYIYYRLIKMLKEEHLLSPLR